jgi:hypothetical protein
MADDNLLDTRPQGTIVAIMSPQWWVENAATKNRSIVQLHHPHHGWLSFLFPPECAMRLGSALVN